MHHYFLLIVFVVVQGLVAMICQADDGAQAAFFESKIRPVLVSECYQCHSASSDTIEGGLLIDTREGIRRGGDTGSAVVPGEPAKSLVLDAMRHSGLEMPPEKKLDASVISDFRKWIASGAYDPRDGKSELVREKVDLRQAREFWSFRPPGQIEVPDVENDQWCKTDIDRFILSRIESKAIKPVVDAESQTLVRRIFFDLVGLPPTVEQVQAFCHASLQDPERAIDDLVTRLLESPQFGERWGRHWLDVVRYAESTGMERNGVFTSAWRYRDYVIDAFNNDLPYDRFIREQIAGDLMEPGSEAEKFRMLTATGMLAIGPKSLNETSKEKFVMDVVDEQIDVVSRAFLGVTASCARCHDHKFDPIPQSEYYALAGIFSSTRTLYGTANGNGNRNPGQLISIRDGELKIVGSKGGGSSKKELANVKNQLKAQSRKLASSKKQLAAAKSDKAENLARKRVRDAESAINRLRARLKQIQQSSENADQAVQLLMGVFDSTEPRNTRLRIRGEHDQYGAEIPRGFLTIGASGKHSSIPQHHSGRLELADWITRPDHPLTARVAVNRIWQHLFGRGIVTTVDNFGANGTRPSHPLLLDHLANEFVASGWSVKEMIRKIMVSRVYRLATIVDESPQLKECLARDPKNQLLWRMNQRRLEGEAIRDAMLAVSGRLDLQRPRASAAAELGEGIVGRTLKVDALQRENDRRSVYLPILRGAVPEALSLFDFPEPSIVGGNRNVTTVPTQALYMMNSASVLGLSQQFSERLLSSKVTGDKARVVLGYQLALSREPSGAEVDRVLAFIRDATASGVNVDKLKHEESESRAWRGFCQSLLGCSEFRYLN